MPITMPTSTVYTIVPGTTTGTNTVSITQPMIWTAWNQAYTCTTGTGNAITWRVWCNDSPITTASTTANVWPQWNDTYQAILEQDYRATRPVTREELREREARWAARQAENERRLAEVDGARRRAEDLLRAHLTEEQLRDLDQKNCFYLESIGKNGARRRYRIDRGMANNVHLLDDKGSIIGTYCAHPTDVPVPDTMLAQKLFIEANEEAFLRVANFRRRSPLVETIERALGA